jgi:xanthine/CO dehydrogenase XdhC/CoxF family maturation factor/cation diffusion facilitator CzcD-associated flavoprotein CzcO
VLKIAEAVLEVLASGQRAALATVIRVSGSTPQQPGARLLLLQDGRKLGTVGGGAIEQAVVEALAEILAHGEPRVMVRELGYELGMCCGGRMELFLEPIDAAPRLLLLGAGHVAQPTAALARSVGFRVWVVDEREELNTAERFPDCQLVLQDPTSFLRRTQLTDNDSVLIVTHDHQLDEAALSLASAQPVAYIGMIGSQRKVFRLLQRSAAKGAAVDLSRVYAPVGLDIGAQGPEEIAVSIVAELIALRRGRAGAKLGAAHLRAVDDPRLLRSLGTPSQPIAADPAPGLLALAARVQSDLSLLTYPQRPWVTSRKTQSGEHVYDVVIIGAGQSGLATAFGLLRERVTNVLVIDDNPQGRAGPWLNFARMRTLRTPKYLTGPDLGIPSLTPRSWYEAQHGSGSWDALGLIPKELWAAYLSWYRQTLGLPVQPDTRVGALRWLADEHAFELPCSPTAEHGLAHSVYARRVVLATGIDGSGYWATPELIANALPKQRYAHTRDPIDFAALSGKRVAVLGAGASAFDNAATALEQGASEVRVFFRRSDLVQVNAYRWAEFVGFLHHLGDLNDADKWRFISQILRMGQLPPADTIRRAQAHAGFHLHPGSAWRKLELHQDGIRIETSSGTYQTDYVIVGTGFVTDLRARPELALLEPHIARWAERYTPPETEQNDELARHPYLGSHFELCERQDGEAPYLSHVYNYTFGGLLSLGFGGASISGMKYSIPRLVSGITSSFFREDREHYYQSLCSFDEREV